MALVGAPLDRQARCGSLRRRSVAADDLSWGFVEMSYTTELGMTVNLSFVDFVGLAVAMQLSTGNGTTWTLRGTDTSAVRRICAALVRQAARERQPWHALCQYDGQGQPIRVHSPGKYISLHPSTFSDYYADYVDAVWRQFANRTLIVRAPEPLGDIPCSTRSGKMECAGASRSFPKPTAREIFGCEGVFGTQVGDNAQTRAVTARLCAALHRTTLLLVGGERQPQLPVSQYYPYGPTNRYSQLVHGAELDGRGYAFPYDDVRSDDSSDVSGTMQSDDPQVWKVYIGGLTGLSHLRRTRLTTSI